jgi:hypothetical protein
MTKTKTAETREKQFRSPNNFLLDKPVAKCVQDRLLAFGISNYRHKESIVAYFVKKFVREGNLEKLQQLCQKEGKFEKLFSFWIINHKCRAESFFRFQYCKVLRSTTADPRRNVDVVDRKRRSIRDCVSSAGNKKKRINIGSNFPN